MKGGAKKKSGEGSGGLWEACDPQSPPMLGDYEDSSPVLHHQDQLSFEDQQYLEHEEELEDGDREEDGDEEDEEGKIKLDEGFYEIEAVRRKRIRKGQLQYLIKWRGWPETANTWEPLENLESCIDVIEAFEESLRSGKHSRKRKRKSSVSITQPKKKQQQHSANVSYNNNFASDSLNNFALADPLVPPQSVSSSQVGEFNGNVITLETTKVHNVNGGFVNVGKNVYGSREGSEYDPKLSELKGALVTNDVTEDIRAIQLPKIKASEGSWAITRHTNVDCAEPAQNNRRTGAKRRKPISVKRFKQELASCATNITIDPGGSLEQPQSEKRTTAGDFSGLKSAYDIVQIIQPISFLASIANNVQDVSVMFKALRSDGKEVIVDNKFLKTVNPLLLIDFYEQHLKYSPTP